jgi:hypothetical protein
MDDATVSVVVEQVLDAYTTHGPLAFAYGQGSTFSGFETDADLDIVLIWPDNIPACAERPADQLCDPGVTPTQFGDAAFGLDNLIIGGRDTQVINFSRSTFGSWCEAVSDGEGWLGPAWPLPLHAVAGFVYGVPLADDNGEAATIRERILRPSAKLRGNTCETLVSELPEYRKALCSSARRSEGWLFHELTVTLTKHAYASWFAAEGCYLPFPKHLDRWIARLDLDRELAHLEQLIWRTSTLIDRQQAVLEFVEGVVALSSDQ